MTTLLALILLVTQIALFILTDITIAQTAREAARVAATLRDGGGDGVLELFVRSRVSVLSAAPALMVPGSLVVETSGTTRSALTKVTVTVEQQPLPLVGWLLSGGIGGRKVRATGEAPGGEAWALPDAPRGELVCGAEQQP